MLKITTATLAFLFCSIALARPFLGAFASAHSLMNTSAELPLIVSVGAQAGVHNLIGPLGVRGTAEVSVYPDFGLSEPLADAPSYRLTEVADDALASLSFVGMKGYVGVGGEVGTIFSVEALSARCGGRRARQVVRRGAADVLAPHRVRSGPVRPAGSSGLQRRFLNRPLALPARLLTCASR
jgi:hypothetical protein